MNNDILQAYRMASHRLLLADYDGTLTEIMPTPPEAVPSPELLELLAVLAHDPANTIVVISGRSKQELQDWLGGLPVWLVAEHGYWRRDAAGTWKQTHAADISWQSPVRVLMERATASCTGSLIEEKISGLSWHYRTAADPAAAAVAVQELMAALRGLPQSTTFRIINGDKVIEVQPAGNDKGAAAQYWLQQRTWDFILAAGDDTTDEDLFAAMPPTAFTLKVGNKETRAKQKLTHPAAMRQLLSDLTTS